MVYEMNSNDYMKCCSKNTLYLGLCYAATSSGGKKGSQSWKEDGWISPLTATTQIRGFQIVPATILVGEARFLGTGCASPIAYVRRTVRPPLSAARPGFFRP